ncbi:unnamed protein product, partial [Trichogramma brassicae]
LQVLRNQFNGEVEKNFIRELYLRIRDWQGRISNENFEDIFRQQLRREEIDLLLREEAKNGHPHCPLIRCAFEINYKDNPDLDEDGKPPQRRTTPVHSIANLKSYGYYIWSEAVGHLFKIYDRFDVNYTDELGFTHFHAACKFNIVEAASQFLELGQDPNLIVPRTLDSPLHLTTSQEVVQLLLEKGADPNRANAKGSTPLHNMCQPTIDRKELMEKFFEINKKIGQHDVQINAQDGSGSAPLHLAVMADQEGAMEILLNNGADPNLPHRKKRMTPLHFICQKIDVSLSRNTDLREKISMAELLLRAGADPNAELEGSTPLHLICQRHHDLELLKKIFEFSRPPVNVNALDSKRRTPLFYAVITLAPSLVHVLLDNGADLSSFTFPTFADFAENKELWISATNYNLLVASGIMAIVESLEKREYKLCEINENNRTIGKLFAKYVLFQRSSDSDIRLKRGKCWFEEDAFVEKAKKIKFTADLSLHEVIELRPEVAKEKLDYLDYFKFASSNDLYKLEKRFSCALHLCEKLARTTFRSSSGHSHLQRMFVFYSQASLSLRWISSPILRIQFFTLTYSDAMLIRKPGGAQNDSKLLWRNHYVTHELHLDPRNPTEPSTSRRIPPIRDFNNPGALKKLKRIFQQFNNGPQYNLTKVTTPVTIFYSDNDWISSVRVSPQF